MHPDHQTLDPAPSTVNSEEPPTEPRTTRWRLHGPLRFVEAGEGTGIQYVYVHTRGVRADALGPWKPQGGRNGWTS